MATDFLPECVDLACMVRVAAGAFIYGCAEDQADPDWGPTVPATRTFVDEFWIDRTPVTYAQYKGFIEATGYTPALRERHVAWGKEFVRYLWHLDRTYDAGLDDIPVVFVNWYDAMAYAEWSGRTLPTEVEWEKAARGLAGQRFPWGDDDDMAHHCNFGDCGVGLPTAVLTPVTRYPDSASPYGCLDMLGNAAEWCWNNYFMPGPEPAALEPVRCRLQPPIVCPYATPVRSAARALRGGNRLSPPGPAVVRALSDPWVRSPYYGFRCVWHPPTRSVEC
jgi:formylglycine-generating enzyme required for sulfatase activity